MDTKAKAKVYGPFECANRIGAEGISLLTVPFKDVANSQILISLSDNVPTSVANEQLADGYHIVTVEIGIWGSVQGYETLIKRQEIKSNWGPVVLRLGDDDAYDKLEVRGRVFIGGKPGIPSNMQFNAGTVLSVMATVHVQPREGFAG